MEHANVIEARGRALARDLCALPAPAFVALDAPEPWPVLYPVLTRGSITLIRGPRGIGKSWLALSLAHAAARGHSVLGWAAPVPSRVLYLDTSMPLRTVQERLATLGAEDGLSERLVILAADAQKEKLPDLGTEIGRAALTGLLEPGVELVVIDSVAGALRGGSGRTARTEAFVAWLAGLRRKGLAVLVIANRAGTLGELADTVLALYRPFDYLPDEGARFSVHTAVTRALAGEEARRFEARLSAPGGPVRWTRIEAVEEEAILAWRLHDQGHSIRAIARILNVSTATAWRLVQRGAKLPPELRLSPVSPALARETAPPVNQ